MHYALRHLPNCTCFLLHCFLLRFQLFFSPHLFFFTGDLFICTCTSSSTLFSPSLIIYIISHPLKPHNHSPPTHALTTTAIPISQHSKASFQMLPLLLTVDQSSLIPSFAFVFPNPTPHLLRPFCEIVTPTSHGTARPSVRFDFSGNIRVMFCSASL